MIVNIFGEDLHLLNPEDEQPATHHSSKNSKSNTNDSLITQCFLRLLQLYPNLARDQYTRLIQIF